MTSTYTETGRSCNGYLRNLPNISTITRPHPHRDTKIVSNFDVDIQCANVIAIHMVPEPEALAPLNSGVALTGKSRFVASSSWIRCFNIHIVA